MSSHQRSALAMMVEKECGITGQAKFPQLWNVVEESGLKGSVALLFTKDWQLIVLA